MLENNAVTAQKCFMIFTPSLTIIGAYIYAIFSMIASGVFLETGNAKSIAVFVQNALLVIQVSCQGKHFFSFEPTDLLSSDCSPIHSRLFGRGSVILQFYKHKRLALAEYEPKFPSTKELHGQCSSTFSLALCFIRPPCESHSPQWLVLRSPILVDSHLSK